jgi:hypothetical protein
MEARQAHTHARLGSNADTADAPLLHEQAARLVGSLIQCWRFVLALGREAELELESLAGCPVCDKDFLIWGADGVVVHLLADHAGTPEAFWVVQKLEVPAMQREFGLRPAC